MLEEIIGHKRNINLLLKLKENEKLPPNMIFEGFEGIGKKLVAKSLFSDKEVSSKDFILVGEDSYPKINDIRNIILSFNRKPLKKYKLAILDNAQDMTLEAANALLKIFEEPPSNTFIILIVNNINKLPKTISSRAKIFKFSPLNKKEIKEFAKKHNIEIKNNPELIEFSKGRPAHLLRIYKYKLIDFSKKFLNLIKEKDFFTYFSLSEKLEKIDIQSFKSLLEVMMDISLKNPLFLKYYQNIVSIYNLINTYPKPKYLLDKLFFDISFKSY